VFQKGERLMKLTLGLFLLAAMQTAVTQTTFHGNNARSGV
jgi:hypothetical protein